MGGVERIDSTVEHAAWIDLVPVRTDVVGDEVPACGMPSPGGAMLCDLPDTGFYHFMGQHLGTDRHGNLRGWKDRRAPVE